jgi:hypothetical protein
LKDERATHSHQKSDSPQEATDRAITEVTAAAPLYKKSGFSMLFGSALLLISNVTFTALTDALTSDLTGIMFVLLWTVFFFLAGLSILRHRERKQTLLATRALTGILACLGLAYHGAMIGEALTSAGENAGDTNVFSGVFWSTQVMALAAYIFICRGIYLLHRSKG